MGRKFESENSSKNLINREIEATIARAGFESLSPELIRVEITDAFRRRLGECRPIRSADRSATATYEIRIASRLFEAEADEQWRDTVRHEVAHAHVFETVGHNAQPHGDAWKAAARRAGADPTARYEGDGLVDGDYILACPQGCFERVYLKRSKRVKTRGCTPAPSVTPRRSATTSRIDHRSPSPDAVTSRVSRGSHRPTGTVPKSRLASSKRSYARTFRIQSSIAAR